LKQLSVSRKSASESKEPTQPAANFHSPHIIEPSHTPRTAASPHPSPAYVSVCQQLSPAYVSVCQHLAHPTHSCVAAPLACIRQRMSAALACIRQRMSARQHTSAYVSIRQHTSAYARCTMRTHSLVAFFFLVAPRTRRWPELHMSSLSRLRLFVHCVSPLVTFILPPHLCMRQDTSGYVRIRQDTSGYVRIRQHTSAYASAYA
jgi:hypothetical protein